MRGHIDQLGRRTRHYLQRLHELLLAPVEDRLGDRRLVVVPYRALHHVPFHALHDGRSYTIERREVCYVPSAGVLRHCFDAPRRPIDRALFVGVPDHQIPLVKAEVENLARLFPQSVTLVGVRATRAALREHASRADVVHLACHGQFRPDNPVFSALRLGDGWLTVRDAYELDLQGRLVTLSACETGAAEVAPGEELIGLVRGFFSAGAPTLLVSLWTVDDAATASLMRAVYERLRAGDSPAAALRAAQCRALREHDHPFFWAPFALFGRW
jgi:CHAT domain-containing protein